MCVKNGQCIVHYSVDIRSGLIIVCSLYDQVSTRSTRSETVCVCDKDPGAQPSTVGTTFYVPYNKIDFKPILSTTDQLGRAPVIGLVVISIAVYFAFLFWALREDAKDQYKVRVHVVLFVLTNLGLILKLY